MIVECIEVRHWRAFRESHVFHFEEGLNLLVGLNEAGKSTLFEVLQRLLFDRHSGKAAEIKAMRPLDSSLAPEAEVLLRGGGRRMRIRKRFLDSPLAELHVEREGSWELDHDGDRADEEVRGLLSGSVPGRGATDGSHRGLGQALWYLQRESDLPDGAWNEAVGRGLQGLVEMVASSPAEEALIGRIAEAYGEFWTPTGRPSSKSALADLQDDLPALEEELGRLRSRLDEAETHRRALESLEVERGEKRARLDEAEGREEELKALLARAGEVEAGRKAAQDALTEAKARRKELESDRSAVTELQEKIQDGTEMLADERSRLADAKADEERLKRDLATAEEEEERLTAEVGALEESLTALEARREALRLELEAERLDTRRARLEELEETLEETRTALAETLAPGADEVSDFQEALEALKIARARAETAGIRIRFELEGSVDVTAEPEAEREEADFIITRPTRFELGELGSVHVRGGGDDLTELDDEIAEREEEVRQVLDRFDVEDQPGLLALRQRREELEERRREAEGLRDELLREGDPREGSAERTKALADARARAEDLSEEDEGLEGEALEARIEEVQRARKTARTALSEVRQTRKDGGEERLELVERRNAIERTVDGLQAEVESRRKDVEEILTRYGTLDQLDRLVEESAGELEAKQEELDALEAEYEEKVAGPRRELESTRDEIDDLRDQVSEVETKAAERMGSIETLMGEGLYSRVGDLEAELEEKRRREPVLQRRADARKLLKDLTDELRRERSDLLAGPVAERVGTWISQLTGDAYDRLELDDGLMPLSLRSTRYDDPLELTHLSHGTREQVVVLLRLALGVLLSDEERHLVVMDDRLVNADRVRIRRMRSVLEEVCDSCQVLLATCDDGPYAGMGAHVVRVPEDGRDTGTDGTGA